MQTSLPNKWDKIAVMDTSVGIIKIRFFSDLTPKTYENFVWLSNKWYYNWTVFHRVINNFMIQWWDPTATGMWWESIFWHEFEDEFSELKHIKWAISMANAGRNTNGSQFFIVHAKTTPHLDWHHAVFWQVFEWLEIVDNIANSKVDREDRPIHDVVINSIEIVDY